MIAASLSLSLPSADLVDLDAAIAEDLARRRIHGVGNQDARGMGVP
jgi:hypothetical protein